jgi:hypothetical protein
MDLNPHVFAIGTWSSSNDIRFRIHGQINLIALYFNKKF